MRKRIDISRKVKSNTSAKKAKSAHNSKNSYKNEANRTVKKVVKENMKKHAEIWRELAKH